MGLFSRNELIQMELDDEMAEMNAAYAQQLREQERQEQQRQDDRRLIDQHNRRS